MTRKPSDHIAHMISRPSGMFWEPPSSVRKVTDDQGARIFRAVKLAADPAAARRQAADLNANLAAWRAAQASPPETRNSARAGFKHPLTFTHLAGLYRASTAFTHDLRPATQEGYRDCLNKLCAEFGDHLVVQITTGWMQRYYDRTRLAAPSYANHQHTALSACLTWGKQQGLIAVNLAKEVRRRGTPPRQVVIEPFEVNKLVNAADDLGRASIGTLIVMQFNLVQRPGDIRTMQWKNRYFADGRARWRFTQSKTGVDIDVEEPEAITARLAATKQHSISHLIISETTGRVYEARNLSHRCTDVFRHAAQACPSLKGKVVKDLRTGGFTHLINSGATIEDVTSISGHTHSEASRLIEVYCPKNKARADRAMKFMKY